MVTGRMMQNIPYCEKRFQIAISIRLGSLSRVETTYTPSPVFTSVGVDAVSNQGRDETVDDIGHGRQSLGETPPLERRQVSEKDSKD